MLGFLVFKLFLCGVKNEMNEIMATISLNIPIEIPNSASLNLEELKRQLTDYARMLVYKSTNVSAPKHGLRSFDELHPAVKELCGVISLAEDDLDGEKARADFWREV